MDDRVDVHTHHASLCAFMERLNVHTHHASLRAFMDERVDVHTCIPLFREIHFGPQGG